ncbi:class I SAM-dependent methyltransferase [Paenibacillus mucilaginosus]|uniref:Methyltransferase type 11 n=1 Tax=Paenibacillus mucilaginosus (strain KNP414) TaxID=1036673 RepID=F8FL16_PAEMK|nr:class I SAM-dependent methyltransferase [Paenibacillus mucilaginosus]AEI39935.1 Methyltransferase type 11 [Paenibacillus mucilaginosus KNP414]MCG7216362.1 class I SAM-dependent methyltransferase [Paenibacillus mucilaginosus]WDM29199.1 class I SAM-dependent methyltransferase [Paenibacillus mucilaginosus]
MKENKYDEPGFFGKYSQMPRSLGGLEAAGEWADFRALLPELDGRRVLDLGCGFGWHCRYAREQGARSVVGIDLSANMLERARAMTSDPQIEYRQLAVEEIDFSEGEFDVVISSLALHYVERFDVICRKVYHCLAPGGTFVLSVEHPIFTALPAQDWYYGPQGEKLHWPVDRYHEEGPRQARFLDHDVVKYHRTVAALVNAIIEAGFRLRKLSELEPTQEMLQRNPAWADEVRRPMFLLAAAGKD